MQATRALFAVSVPLLILAGCATGMAGSARRACYDAGLQPGTPAFTDCWQAGAVGAQADLGALVAATAVVAAASSAPAAPGRLGSFGALKAEYQSGLNRICVYDTARGDYSMTATGGYCPATIR